VSDLVAFLRARLAEDEQTARAAPAGPWTYERVFSDLSGAVMDGPLISGEHTDGYIDPESAAHIARHDPARVLAEVDAKRRIIDQHVAAVLPGGQVPDVIYCPTCNGPDWDMYPMPDGCTTLRLLALPYAGHEDYREEWRP